MTDKLRVGAVISSGGAAFTNAYEIFNNVYDNQIEAFIVTDRACGIEAYCSENNIHCERIEEKDKTVLSQKIATHFDEVGDVDFIILFFLRILTEDIFKKHITLNSHPSMLPDFAGLSAVKQAYNAGAENIGSTIHMVNEVLDGGFIVGQLSSPLKSELTLQEAESLSFCQKVYLFLWLLSQYKANKINFKWDEEKGYLPIHSESFDSQKIILNDKNLEDAFEERISDLGYKKFVPLIVRN